MSDTVENIGLRPIDLGDGAFVQLPHDVQVVYGVVGVEWATRFFFLIFNPEYSL